MRLFSDTLGASDVRDAVPYATRLDGFKGVGRPSEFKRKRGWTFVLKQSGWTNREATDEQYGELLIDLREKDPNLVTSS